MSQKNDFEEGRSEIKINRKMRTWYKYKNYCIMAGGLVGAILLVMLCVSLFTGGKDKDNNIVANNQSSTAAGLSGEGQSPDIGQNAGEPQSEQQSDNSGENQSAQESQSSQETEAGGNQGGSTVLAVAGNAVEEEFTSADAFANSVFLGDTVVGGMSFYRHLSADQVVSDNNMTSDKSINHVDSVMSKNPQKVFIMLGLNDANYENRTVETIVNNISETVAAIKAKNSSVQVYILSATPVSSAFEARANISVRQSFLDEMNAAFAAKAPEIGATYIDVATAFKDGSGYMRTECTGNGSTVVGTYYPFMLNGIASVLQ